ncbi:MAG TPA: helix-turn-helix domain-containing protein [Puia sp.]|nr:helix-turn-helix domain-containing protein [Puia sp.]
MLKKLKLLSNPFKEHIADYAVQYILNKKAESNLDQLIKDCNISNRYLQKVFVEKIGYSPKFFIRIVRFQQALHYLCAGKIGSLTALGYRAGYFDQAHFIREFKEFTGLAPSQFHPAKHPINQHFLGS